MRIERQFTEAGKSPYAAIGFRQTTSEIRNPDGSVVFKLDAIDVPQAWSQVAADVLAQKYFRKAGVAKCLKKVKEKGVPAFLRRSVPDQKALAKLPEDERFGGEISAIIMEEAFDDLDGPVARVCGADVPIPYAKALEQAALPNPQQIADAALALF